MFERVLGITSLQAESLRRLLLAAAGSEEATAGASDEYGQRHVVDLKVETSEKTAVIRSAWIVKTGEDSPRFTSCYVLEERRPR